MLYPCRGFIDCRASLNVDVDDHFIKLNILYMYMVFITTGFQVLSILIYNLVILVYLTTLLNPDAPRDLVRKFPPFQNIIQLQYGFELIK